MKQSAMEKPLKIAVIAGEESGDLLAADMLAVFMRQYKHPAELIGVGGAHLQKLGLSSFFSREDIALIGIWEALKKLPRLICHIRRLSAYLAREKPDFLLIVDSPDFTHRVAKRLRRLAPEVPIVQYVAPSVWAWREGRAAAMRGFIDLLLVILPFEPQVLARLNGPKSVYVGHRLLSYPPLRAAYEAQRKKAEKAGKSSGRQAGKTAKNKDKKTLLMLPGSRYSEIKALMPVFGAAAAELQARQTNLEILVPTLPHLLEKLQHLAQDWPVKPHFITEEAEKWAAFARADAALAASGTVSLELALCAVPTVLAYKTDWLMTKFIVPRLKIWSAALPNIITDEAVVPEYFNEYVRAPMLARQIERLLDAGGAARQAQLAGFQRLRQIMQTEKPAAELAVQALAQAGIGVSQKNKQAGKGLPAA